MTNYDNGKIYKLTFGIPKHFYIGSTVKDLNQRLANHRIQYVNYKDDLFNAIMDSNLDEWKIELIEDYPCNTQTDLRKREQYYIELLKPTMNINKAYKKDGIMTERKKRVSALSQKKKDYNEIKKLEKARYKEEYESKFIICGCGKKVYNIPYKMNIHLESAKHKKFEVMK